MTDTPQRHPGGRPSSYSLEVVTILCERIASGQSVREICRADDMPAESSVYNWLPKHPEFMEKYARAKEAQAEYFAGEILEISDDGRNDWMARQAGDDGAALPDHEHISRSRLRVDSRKWLMSKLLPKKYGERQQVDHGVTGELSELLTAIDGKTRGVPGG